MTDPDPSSRATPYATPAAATKRDTMRRGAVASGILHGLAMIVLIVGVPTLWLWLKGVFDDEKEFTPVDWQTLMPVTAPEDDEQRPKPGQTGPRGGRPERATGEQGNRGTGSAGSAGDGQHSETATRAAPGADSRDKAKDPPVPRRTATPPAAPPVPAAPPQPGSLAVEIVDPSRVPAPPRPDDADRDALPRVDLPETPAGPDAPQGEREARAARATTAADARATPGAGPRGEKDGDGARAGGEDGTAPGRAADAPEGAARDSTARDDQARRPADRPAPKKPKTRDLDDTLAYLEALDPQIGDAMRRYRLAKTEAETTQRETEAETHRAEKDAKSFARIMESAELGYPPAQFGAGIRKLLGHGTDADPQEALRLLNRAADQNYVSAQRVLGFLYAKGIGAPQDLARAHFHWSQAADAGDKVASEAREMVNPLMTAQQVIESKKMMSRWSTILSEVALPQPDPHQRKAQSEELREAAARGDIARVRALLALGVDAQSTDEGGKTALINAAWRGYERVVEVMVEFGSDPDFTDENGLTALSWAAINGHRKAVEALIATGAETNPVDEFGMTPLMRAAWNGHREAVAALLVAGADASIRSKKGETALDLARREGYQDIVTLIQSRR